MKRFYSRPMTNTKRENEGDRVTTFEVHGNEENTGQNNVIGETPIIQVRFS